MTNEMKQTTKKEGARAIPETVPPLERNIPGAKTIRYHERVPVGKNDAPIRAVPGSLSLSATGFPPTHAGNEGAQATSVPCSGAAIVGGRGIVEPTKATPELVRCMPEAQPAVSTSPTCITSDESSFQAVRQQQTTATTTTTQIMPDGSQLVTKRVETLNPDGSVVVEIEEQKVNPTRPIHNEAKKSSNFTQPMSATQLSNMQTIPSSNLPEKPGEDEKKNHRVLLLAISFLCLSVIIVAITVPLVLKNKNSQSNNEDASKTSADVSQFGISTTTTNYMDDMAADVPESKTSTTSSPAFKCPEFPSGVYEAQSCWQSDSGYREYGVRLEIPEGNDCTSGTECLFSYPGLTCYGYITYLGQCGFGCRKFEEHYVVEGSCVTEGNTVFTLQETPVSGEYTHSWSTTSTNVFSVCENVQGPPLGCEGTETWPTQVACKTLPSGVYTAKKCHQSNTGYRDYGVRIEIPPHSDCSTGSRQCLFSYPGLSCHGYVLFDGSCGEGCFRFSEHYVVTTGCYTTGSPAFSLQETADGQYTFDWSASGTDISARCDNVLGPHLICYE